MGRGSSKAGGSSGGGGAALNNSLESISGKPFDKNDFTTWTVGTEVRYAMDGDIYETDDGAFQGESSGYIYPGTVREVHEDHLIIDVPIISDHMWVDADIGADDFIAVKSGESKKKRSK